MNVLIRLVPRALDLCTNSRLALSFCPKDNCSRQLFVGFTFKMLHQITWQKYYRISLIFIHILRALSHLSKHFQTLFDRHRQGQIQGCGVGVGVGVGVGWSRQFCSESESESPISYRLRLRSRSLRCMAQRHALNLFDWRYTALDIFFFEKKKTFSVLDERFQRKKRKTVDSPEPVFYSACYF